MPNRVRIFRWTIALLAIALAAAPVLAQYGQSTGGIQGRVTDEQGGVLPGVQVTLRGPGAPQTAYTDARGEFRVANLDPGTYTITLTLAGFQTVNRENVAVSLGRNTELTIPMGLTRVEAAVTVSSEAPILETKRVQTSAIVSQQELKAIPTARDPWVILQTAPGVQIDRMNVAGSESGQQSNFLSHGSGGGTFTVDGVNVTDMSALGSSAAYYDFDMFQEMQVITSGGDASIAGSGAHLNMITKRGTNDLHGSARVFGVDERFQSDNLPDEALEQAAPLASGNHIQSLQDYGAEAGGPIWRDHLWLWGAYGRDQINLITAGGASDKTTLENLNAKLNWQIVPSNAANGWWMHSDKLKFGRSAGPTRPQETTWDQTLPQNTWKVEDSQVFSSSLFATAQYNGINGNFTLDPEGGNRQAFIDEGGVWHNSYQIYAAPRPQRQAKADVSYFFNTGALGHELKAGFGYLSSGARSHSIWPGNAGSGPTGLAGGSYGSLFDCTDENDETLPCAVITRQSNLVVDNKYWSAYLQDTFSLDRLSINVGVRWDKQTGENQATIVPGNPSFPDLLPAIDYPGSGEPFTWEDWQPRLGLTYALGANRTTVLKASYARYAEALGTGLIDNINPIGAVSYAYYGWNDANHNNLVEVGEVDTNTLINTRNFDPANPGAAFSVDSFASGINAPLTDEILFGVDHELFPAFAVGVAYTYRKFNDLITRNPTGITRDDYELERIVTGTLPDGTPYSVPTYTIVGVDVPPGYVYDNRSDYDQTYHGVDLILTKRLANRWMARGSFTYNWNKQHVGSGGCIDPTNTVPGQGADVGNPQTAYTAQTCADDVAVGFRSTGSGDKSSVFLSSKWQFSMNAMYQLPLGFNVAGSFYGREGYPLNWWRRITGADGVQRDLAVSDLEDQRYDNVYELDMRLEKVVAITASANLTISADVFNVTNEDTILQRFNRLNRSGLAVGNTNDIKEIQSPRVWRFGLRLAF
jgi:hypothetical protein